MKLMILGQDNVGKTTTAKRVTKKWKSKDNLFTELGNQNLSTDGIDIDTFYFPLQEEKEDVYVSIFSPLATKFGN